MCGRMAELVDALASGASVRKNVEVQVLFRPPFDSLRSLMVNQVSRMTLSIVEGPVIDVSIKALET